jgi:hypothetical protein
MLHNYLKYLHHSHMGLDCHNQRIAHLTASMSIMSDFYAYFNPLFKTTF